MIVVVDVLSAALDAGTAIGVLLVYFWCVGTRVAGCRVLTCGSLQYPRNGRIGQHSINLWWGNTVFKNTTDWKGTPLRELAPGETFG